jgi:hypothetical protein
VFSLFVFHIEVAEAVEYRMLPSATSYQRALFGEAKTPQCSIVSRGLGSSRLLEFPEVNQLIDEISKSFNNRNGTEFKTLFHPRLKVTSTKATQMLDAIANSYGTRGQVDANLYRAYALFNIDGSPQNIECPDDKLSIGTHYGFPLQFGAWFQITGKKELARLYVSIVPTETAWRIAAWHLQQWTHIGKDAEAWVAEALSQSTKDNKPAAYAKLDLAYKLLDGGKFIYLQLRKDIEATRDAMLPAESNWLKTVQSTAPKASIVYAGTFLAREGVGILTRVTTDTEINLKEKEKICGDLANEVFKVKWTSALAGLHCDFTTPNSPPERRGVIGGVSIHRTPKA